MSVASLEAKLSRLQSEKKKLQKRKSAVKKIVKKICKQPTDDVDDIRKSGKKTAEYLEKAVKGVGHIDRITDDIRTSAKSAHGLDEWGEKSWLSKEVNRLENEIEDMERQIERISAQLREAREAERAAALEKFKEIF